MLDSNPQDAAGEAAEKLLKSLGVPTNDSATMRAVQADRERCHPTTRAVPARTTAVRAISGGRAIDRFVPGKEYRVDSVEVQALLAEWRDRRAARQ